ncbi:MAG: tungstate ABC transporter substrate-binding protein WtpA [Gemmatimonadales bacterium]|nr:tungstate ABC transporter substrate-binding protein WtpA [Gemmatimonadales bacterium]
MRRFWSVFLGIAAPALLAASRLAAQPASGPLVVFNAGSLAYPFRELLNAFTKANPGVRPMQESSGSLEAARKLTELGKIPDILGVADYGVIAKLLMPAHARWYVTFASNAMVLAHTDRSIGAGEITGENWWRILLRPGVRVGRSDPSLDPNGYRALMVYQLAEAHYRQPGLAARLLAASPARYIRPKEADLTALLQAGELDYAWSYRSLAMTAGLRRVDLPAEVDLRDAAKAAWYSQAKVRLPAGRQGGAALEFVGEPIVYALTIPNQAPHPATARAFVRFVLSPAGREILARSGFQVLPKPLLTGDSAGAAVIP